MVTPDDHGRRWLACAECPATAREERLWLTRSRDLREKLDDEFRDVRDGLGAASARPSTTLEKAGPEDDLYALLETLEEVAKDVRNGGLIGGGAKGHRKALRALPASVAPARADAQRAGACKPDPRL